MPNTKDHSLYLHWIIDELNDALEINPFTRSLHTPLAYEEIIDSCKKIKEADRLLVAAEVYRWVMGGKWRILDLENIIRNQSSKEYFSKKEIRADIKHLIENQEIRNKDVLKICLLLTGINEDLINDMKFVLQKRSFNTHNPNKLWSQIGYYDMKDKSIHISLGMTHNNERFEFPVENILETLAHEFGHHIYISILSKRFKTPPGTLKKIREIIKRTKISKSMYEHRQWAKLYKKDYEKDWIKNKALHIIPKQVYMRYGLENELFAKIISGTAAISKGKRKKLIMLINESCALASGKS